jgi:hypothetical protein
LIRSQFNFRRWTATHWEVQTSVREKAAYDLLTLALGAVIFGWGVLGVVRREITLPSKQGWSHSASGATAQVVGTAMALLGGYFVGAALGWWV